MSEVPMPDAVELETKPWYRSTTLWFNALALLVYLLGVFLDNYHALGIVLPASWAAWLAMASILGNAALRFKTARPISIKREMVQMPIRSGTRPAGS